MKNNKKIIYYQRSTRQRGNGEVIEEKLCWARRTERAERDFFPSFDSLIWFVYKVTSKEKLPTGSSTTAACIMLPCFPLSRLRLPCWVCLSWNCVTFCELEMRPDEINSRVSRCLAISARDWCSVWKGNENELVTHTGSMSGLINRLISVRCFHWAALWASSLASEKKPENLSSMDEVRRC